MIAMALACDPAIVIGDEPTTALDVMVQAQILELLEELRKKLGLSLILITHDLSVIAETCDRVLIMYAGRVAEEGPVDDVFRRPRHPYTQKLLAAFPNIATDRRTLEVIPGSPPDLRNPPPGCRFAPRCFAAMAICSEVVPPETDVRRRPGRLPSVSRRRSDGAAGRRPHPADAIGPTVVGVGLMDDRGDLLRLRRARGPLPDPARAVVDTPIARSAHARRRPGGRRHRPDAAPRARSSRSSANRAAARRRPGGSSSS